MEENIEELNHQSENETISNNQNGNKDRNKLTTNIIFNTLYQILIIITPLITAPYISRILQSDGVGIYSYTHSLVTYFTMFAALGTASYGKRMIALRRDNKKDCSKAFWEIELITVFTTAIMMVIWLLLSTFYKEYSTYLFILSLYLLATLFDISWFYAGLEKFQFSVIINSIFKIISVVLILTLVKTKADLWIYFLIYCGSTLLGNISMWIFLPKFLCKTNIDFHNMGKHLKNTLVYFAPTIATSIYTVLDKTLIGLLIQGNVTVYEDGVEVVKKLSDIENGYYEQANKIISLVKGVAFASINGVMESRVSYLYGKGDSEGIKKIQKTTLNITSFLSIGASFGLIAIASTFVPIFFGSGYDKTVILMYILSPIIFIICVSNVLGSVYYTPCGKRKESTYYLIAGSIINLVLNIPFILLYNSIGAAIASVIAECVISILYLARSRKYVFSFKEFLAIIWKKLVAGGLMLVAVLLVTNYLLNGMNEYLSLMIQLALGVFVYLLSLIILRDDSFKKLFEFFKNKKRGSRI